MFDIFESLEIGYICGGKIYEDIKQSVSSFDDKALKRYKQGRQDWDYLEMGDRRGSWQKFRRAIFCRPRKEGAQKLLSFARPETILYTNLGMRTPIDKALRAMGKQQMLRAEWIIGSYHERGSDELVHRALKDFGNEELPFKRFAQNSAFYYVMVTAFFLFEAFKEDVCKPVIEVGSYATTVRRRIIDLAGKIVSHGGKVTLKIARWSYDHLDFKKLWMNSGSPPQLTLP